MSTAVEKVQETAVERQPATIYEVLRDLARDPAVDVARIAGLMDLQIKAEDRQAEREFNAAFARLQPKLPKIGKRGEIDMGAKGKLTFAKFEDIHAAVMPLLAEEGFSVSFPSEPTASGVLMLCTLHHAAGHSKTSRMQLPADAGPGRNGLQALGSARQYAKRYLFCDVLNIVTVGLDDDGSSIGTIGEREVKFLQRAILTVGVDETKLLAIYGAKALSDIPKSVYRAVQTQIEAKYRTKLQNEGDDDREISYKLAKLWAVEGAK